MGSPCAHLTRLGFQTLLHAGQSTNWKPALPFSHRPQLFFSYAPKTSSLATRVQSPFRKPAKLASSEVQMGIQLGIPNAGSKGEDQPLQAWGRQPDLLEGSSSPVFGSSLSDRSCVPWVLEKAVCLHSSAVFLRATTCWWQK